MKSSLATVRARVPAADADEDEHDDSSAPVSRGAGAGAAGGAGFPGFPGMGAGGMPDLASMMQNPAIMNMCAPFLWRLLAHEECHFADELSSFAGPTR